MVINYKWGAFDEGSAVYDIERGRMGELRPEVWQNDTSVSKTAWSWVEGHQYKTVAELLAELADVVSKNGVLLMNVGPKADGTIPLPEQQILEGMCAWLSRHGEAILGTRPWVIPAEGPTQAEVGSFVDGDGPVFTADDYRFTTRTDVTGDYLYAIGMEMPESGTLHVRAFGRAAGVLGREIAEVHLLGSSATVERVRTADALEVRLPEGLQGPIGPVVKVFVAPVTVPARHDFLHG